jgi:hypothetical protein
MKNATGGSDVHHVLDGDHATAARAYLVNKGFTDWEVVLADDVTLMLDYDDSCIYNPLPDKFDRARHILDQVPEQQGATFKASASKGGNVHVIVHLNYPMPIVERIAWQAAFGSDPKREALHLLSVSRGELNPILLFMRKPEVQKLLGDGNEK